MDTNLDNFSEVKTMKPEKPIYLSMGKSCLLFNTAGVKAMLSVGATHIGIKISKDKSTIAIVSADETNNSLVKKGGLVRNLSMKASFIENIIAGMTNNRQPKYLGHLDKEKKAIFFDLSKPIFDKD